jgi:hypothetical protein
MYVGSNWEMMMAGTTVTIKMAKTRYGSSWLELPMSRDVNEVIRAGDGHAAVKEMETSSRLKAGKEEGR